MYITFSRIFCFSLILILISARPINHTITNTINLYSWDIIILLFGHYSVMIQVKINLYLISKKKLIYIYIYTNQL